MCPNDVHNIFSVTHQALIIFGMQNAEEILHQIIITCSPVQHTCSAFSALTLLDGHQENHPDCKN